MVIIIGWHFPDPFDLAVQSEPVHIMEHATLSIGAIVFWWNIITPVPVRPNLSYLAKIPYIFLAVVPIFILGAFITYSPTPWYDAYATSTLVYGISRIEDQQIGGVLMWIPGSFILLTALIIALLQLVRNEEESQRDREQKGTQISQHNETT
jgi:cytochrome c oxidase assembly factor CtaG